MLLKQVNLYNLCLIILIKNKKFNNLKVSKANSPPW